jgi:hypothetical protein
MSTGSVDRIWCTWQFICAWRFLSCSRAWKRQNRHVRSLTCGHTFFIRVKSWCTSILCWQIRHLPRDSACLNLHCTQVAERGVNRVSYLRTDHRNHPNPEKTHSAPHQYWSFTWAPCSFFHRIHCWLIPNNNVCFLKSPVEFLKKSLCSNGSKLN